MCSTLIIPSKTAEKQNTEPKTSAYGRNKREYGFFITLTDKFISFIKTYNDDNINYFMKQVSHFIFEYIF